MRIVNIILHSFPKVFLVLLSIGLYTSQANAQLYVEGTSLHIQKNAVIKVETNLVTAKPSVTPPKIRNWGTIAVTGNTQFHKDTDYKGQGDLCLLGSSQQSLTTNGIPLKKLDIRNSNNVELGDSMNIQGELKLTSGFLLLGNHNLTIDDSVTLTGGSSSSYIRINGTGKVKATVGSSPKTLPIGRNPYLPIILDDGGDKEYTVGVADKVYANPVTSTTEQTSNVVSETWTIQASGSQSNVSVTIQWNGAEEETGFTRAASHLSYWEDGVSSVWDIGSSASAAGSDPYSLTRTVSFTSNLFYFGVGSSGSALPVELTYFNAEWVTSTPLSNPNTTPLSNPNTTPLSNQPNETAAERSRETYTERSRSARLSWQTSTEENNSHFEVQRSLRLRSGTTDTDTERNTDTERTSLSGRQGRSGMNWETIGTVAGQGTTLQTQDYEFVDHDLAEASSIIYYRLKQIDYNGEFEYSVIRTLSVDDSEFDGAGTFTIFPNPSRTQVIYANKMDSYRVLSTTGKVLKQFSNTTSIDVSDLATGTYIIQNTKGSTQLYMRK